jgi:hypothetical protein
MTQPVQAIAASLGAAMLTSSAPAALAAQPTTANPGEINPLVTAVIQRFNDPIAGYANRLDLNRLSSGKAIPVVPADVQCLIGIPAQPLPAWAKQAGFSAKSWPLGGVFVWFGGTPAELSWLVMIPDSGDPSQTTYTSNGPFFGLEPGSGGAFAPPASGTTCSLSQTWSLTVP